MGFCEGCGQPALSATREGRPICPDCIEEGYGDENTDPDMATIAYFAGAKDARDKIAALQAHADALAGASRAMLAATPEHDNYCSVGALYNCTCDLKPANDQARASLRAYEAFKAGEPT